MISFKKMHALELAESIVDSGETGVTVEGVRGWSDGDLYDWVEAWGYVWVDGQGWIDLEDIDYPEVTTPILALT